MEEGNEHDILVRRVEKRISGFATEPQFRQFANDDQLLARFSDKPYEVSYIFDFFAALDGIIRIYTAG